jgi:hypothetical protein
MHVPIGVNGGSQQHGIDRHPITAPRLQQAYAAAE